MYKALKATFIENVVRNEGDIFDIDDKELANQLIAEGNIEVSDGVATTTPVTAPPLPVDQAQGEANSTNPLPEQPQNSSENETTAEQIATDPDVTGQGVALPRIQ